VNVQSNLLFWIRTPSKIVRGKPECCYNLIGKQHALRRIGCIYCSSGTTHFSPSQNQDASKTVLNKRDAGTRVTCNFHRPRVQRTPHTHTPKPSSGALHIGRCAYWRCLRMYVATAVTTVCKSSSSQSSTPCPWSPGAPCTCTA
jgi:hypothetical protein